MGCCIIGAILIAQFLAAWRARKRIVVAALVVGAAVVVLAYQYQQHAQHIQQFVWDVQAMARGEDPAVAALSQPQLRCQATAAPQLASSDARPAALMGYVNN